MAVNINNLIAAINPDLFCSEEKKSEVKKLAKEGKYLEAAEKAELKEIEFINFIDIGSKNAASLGGIKAPVERHQLVYDSFGESLEPIYFWMLDKMNELYRKVDKLVDNFTASPGSNQFGEMGMRLTKMQEEASKLMGSANTVIKSILNIIYDLKEFQMRLAVYDELHSEEKSKKEAALLSLKQVWMDTVDLKRGNSSIKALALSQQGGFVTLIDAFMAVEDEKLMYQGKEIDLNERIKRLLKQRILEFFLWLKESEKELRKRFEIEKTYLKSQVNAVKIYSRWLKPYLRAAKGLEQNMAPNAALINTFSTALFEITLLGDAGAYKIDDDVTRGDLPKVFKEIAKSKKTKKFHPVIVLEFYFRSAPERISQGYGFRGRAEATFTSYALSEEELAILKKELDKDDINDAMRMIEGATTESLEQLQLDIDSFLGPEKKEAQSASAEDTNPFSALLSMFKSEKKPELEAEKKEKEKKISLRDDNYEEKIIRSQALIEARRLCYRVYDLYKKTHRMPSLRGYA